jgi:hypothetical protein
MGYQDRELEGATAVLELNKETLRDLDVRDANDIRGGIASTSARPVLGMPKLPTLGPSISLSPSTAP